MSPTDAIKGTYLDYRQEKGKPDLAKGPIPSLSKRPPSTEAPNADIAPWMDDGLPALSNHGLTSSNFFNDGSSKAQRSPSFRPGSGRTVDSESLDPMFQGNNRRPSLASATTVDSQTSLSKTNTSRGAPHKKVAGFFGDEVRQSPRSSDTSIPSTLQREQTSSSLHGSRHASRDEGRPISPSSSRPRTPLPSSDVVPWLFQDFKVSSSVSVRASSPHILAFSTRMALACLYRLSSNSMHLVLAVLATFGITIFGIQLLQTCFLLYKCPRPYSRGVDLLDIAMSDIQSHNGRDPSCFGSRDRPLTRLYDRKSHNTAMLRLGKRQLASISSDMWTASLPPMLITTSDFIFPTTDIIEVRRNPPSLHPRMQEMANPSVLLPIDKIPCLTFAC